MPGRLKSKRFLLLIALILGICLRWYVTDIFLFTPILASIIFCLLMQVDDKYVALIHTKPIIYEDLTDPKSKFVYLVFIRLSMAISLVFVSDYILLYYQKQSIYQTIGIIGGLYNIYNKVESRLAKLSLLFTYYVIHKQNPYHNHNDEDSDNGVGIIPVH